MKLRERIKALEKQNEYFDTERRETKERLAQTEQNVQEILKQQAEMLHEISAQSKRPQTNVYIHFNGDENKDKCAMQKFVSTITRVLGNTTTKEQDPYYEIVE